MSAGLLDQNNELLSVVARCDRSPVESQGNPNTNQFNAVCVGRVLMHATVLALALLTSVSQSQNCRAQIHAVTRATIGGREIQDSGVFSSQSYISGPLVGGDDTIETAHAIATGNPFPTTPHFHLRALSSIERFEPTIRITSANSVAQATWLDDFTVSGSSIPNTLRVHYSLTGRVKLEELSADLGRQEGYAAANLTIESGSYIHQSYVEALGRPGGMFSFTASDNLNVNLSEPETDGFWRIAGTSFFDMQVRSTSATEGRGNLYVFFRTSAFSGGAMNSTADFLNTFGYTAITLVDGTPLSQTDLSLQFGSMTAVPEPSTGVLIFAAFVPFALIRSRLMRPCSTQPRRES